MSGQLTFLWDPKNYEVRSKSVELQLQPLVDQVTTLLNSDKTTRKGRGRSKKAVVMVAALERAIQNFLQKGEEVANENPEVKNEMNSVLGEIRTTGEAMVSASKDFAASPCDSQKRTEMVKAARSLLAAVTRLLCLADMIDAHLLLGSLETVKNNLEQVRKAETPAELLTSLGDYKRNTNDLVNRAGRRQQDMVNAQNRDDFAAARAVLKKSHTMLLSASKAYISHPQIAAARNNRDEMIKQLCEAVNTIGDLTQGRARKSQDVESPGALAKNFEEFEKCKEVRSKVNLEQQLEELINGAMLISDSDFLRNERREKIVAGCNALRDALQGVLSLSLQPAEEKTKNEMARAVDTMSKRARELRRQLHKAVADRISDNFLATNTPLLALVEAAKNGDAKKVEEAAVVFQEHCAKLVKIAKEVCELSNSEDGIKMVLHAAQMLQNTAPGVINAARLLAAMPESDVAKENMETYKQAWESQVQLLLDAVDDVTTIDDVLSVMETRIVDDINDYITALQNRDVQGIAVAAEDINARSKRICDLVGAEMDNYEPCTYTNRVLQALKMLNGDTVPYFNRKTKVVVQSLTENPDKEVDENEFIDATRLVYEGVREVRRAVLMNRADEDLDPEEVELEDTYSSDTLSRPQTDSYNGSGEITEDMSGITAARQAINQLPEADKRKILQEVESFQSEKQSFDREVAKWDDARNDIVVLAKYMCIIMMQMTDFVRQRGPLKYTTDVINAAKKISEAGTKLDQLTRQIADQCPESSTKNDLLAYLERVALYSHQISIVSKVKADIQNSSEQLIATGVESATSLIENAKNLMNAVVLTVKTSYVASTKYSRHGTISSPIVVWRMKVPEKKPLVRPVKNKEVTAVIRKASLKKPASPLTVLSQFQNTDEML